MKDRKPFNVKRIAAIHNIILCILSAVMFLGITLNITKEVSDWGLRGAYCQPQGQQSEGSMWYWFYIYYLSKFLELFDTVLIVLGKVLLPSSFILLTVRIETIDIPSRVSSCNCDSDGVALDRRYFDLWKV
jgi:hypothetical protein